jgi:hypothetical protein
VNEGDTARGRRRVAGGQTFQRGHDQVGLFVQQVAQPGCLATDQDHPFFFLFAFNNFFNDIFHLAPKSRGRGEGGLEEVGRVINGEL